MWLFERYLVRIANFADRHVTTQLLNAVLDTRSVIATHLILELIRRLRNSACPIGWEGSPFLDTELGRDELSNAAYYAAVRYCLGNTSAVAELLNIDGLRSWLEDTLRAHPRLLVPGVWALADWTIQVMGIEIVDPSQDVHTTGDAFCRNRQATAIGWC